MTALNTVNSKAKLFRIHPLLFGVLFLFLAACGQTAATSTAPPPTQTTLVDEVWGELNQRPAVQPPQKIKVFILLGQSNMAGYVTGADFPAEYHQPDPQQLFLYNDRLFQFIVLSNVNEATAWIPLIPLNANFNGPEYSFVDSMASAWPDDTLGVIKLAMGETGIRAFLPNWTPQLASVTDDQDKGPLYQAIQFQIHQARSLGEVEFMGVLWNQGGKDAFSDQAADGYVDYLAAIIAALRQDTGNPDLPLFIASHYTLEEIESSLVDLYLWGDDRPATPQILRAYHEAAAAIPNTFVVVHGVLPLQADGIHFTAEGQILQGQFFAHSVLSFYQDK